MHNKELEERRLTGEFYTPKLFVDKAHEYLSDIYGDDWKERYIVWDCCAGKAALTKDYVFKELYISTLEQEDLDYMEEHNINPEAIKFQMDFLNDDDGISVHQEVFDFFQDNSKPSKVPIALIEAIKSGKEVLFLINPPYVGAGDMCMGEGESREGLMDTDTNYYMNQDKMGSAASAMAAQFIYKIMMYQKVNKHIHLAVFNSPIYLTGGSYKRFRKLFFHLFGFERAFLFCAKHFGDLSALWGVSFAVFSNAPNEYKYEFIHEVVDDV